jgi:hypothetical protein
MTSLEKLLLILKDKLRETSSYTAKGVFAEVILIAQDIDANEKRKDHEKENKIPSTPIERNQNQDS